MCVDFISDGVLFLFEFFFCLIYLLYVRVRVFRFRFLDGNNNWVDSFSVVKFGLFCFFVFVLKLEKKCFLV